MKSLRILRKNWKLAVIAVFSLSIAMALGVVSLSLSNTFLLLPPSGVEPDRLVMMYNRSPGKAIEEISYPDYKYLRENNHGFTDVAAAPNSISINFQSSDGREIRVVSRPVSDNYFDVLGLKPFLGRLLQSGDDRSQPPVAVMTYNCWRRLGSNPKVIGSVVAGRTIVGVAPKAFTGSLYGLNGDLILALSGDESGNSWMSQRDSRQLMLLARLKPGVSRRQAQTEMEALSGQLASAYPKEDKGRVAVLTRATLLPPDALPTAELVGAILMALVVLVLLIACANVANLLLAVAVGRRQEAAIKLALGAQRGRLVREFLKDSAIICAASAVLGYAIASVMIVRFSDISVALPMFGSYSIGLNLHLDVTVAAATLALMLVAMFATGLAPALYASNPHLSQVLSGEIAVGGTRKNARRNALVIVQVGVCTLVLVGMGLCQRSLYNLRHVDTGFSARNLVADALYPKNEGLSEAKGKQLYLDLRREVGALPGVESVTLASDLPLFSDNQIPAQLPDGGRKISAGHAVVDSDYFGTVGIRLRAGRVFNSGDREGGPDAVVINRKMAETLFPGQDPVGKTIVTGDPGRTGVMIGVVADSKYNGLDDEARPYFYYALGQHYQDSINVIARTKADPRLWVEPLAQTVRKLGLQAPIRPVTYDGWMSVTILPQRITAASVAVLSGLGLALAIVGLFGAISYSVSERKKELGIRVALGAGPWQLLQMIFRQTCVVAGAGIFAGVLLGVGATVLLESQFFGISAVEWTVLVPVAVGMLAVSLLVAYVSARPWIKVNPMDAVRHA